MEEGERNFRFPMRSQGGRRLRLLNKKAITESEDYYFQTIGPSTPTPFLRGDASHILLNEEGGMFTTLLLRKGEVRLHTSKTWKVPLVEDISSIIKKDVSRFGLRGRKKKHRARLLGGKRSWQSSRRPRRWYKGPTTTRGGKGDVRFGGKGNRAFFKSGKAQRGAPPWARRGTRDFTLHRGGEGG